MLREAQVALNRLRGYASVGPVRLPIDRAVLSWRAEKTLARGKYEWKEAAVAKNLLRDGDVVLELGGGLGYISTYLRRASGAGRIVTYEANPELIAYIGAVHRLNMAVNIDVRHGVVLANPQAPTTRFHIRQSILESSLSEADGPVSRAVDVPVVRLRDVLDDVRPTAAVIDIEGGEIDVLEADDLLPIRRLVLEIHPALYGTPGMARTFAALRRHGFAYKTSASRDQVLALER